MESRPDDHGLPRSEFDLPLNLAATGSARVVPEYTGHDGGYREYPTVSPPVPLLRTENSPFDTTATSHGLGRSPANPTSPALRAGTPKPKRVRTGCLTCRERHLKCDEALPRCQNCQKSARLCKRGVRLNFIDTQIAAPPLSATSPRDWRVVFQDESREIASEYVGGDERYPPAAGDDPETTNSDFYDFYQPNPEQQGLSSGNSLLSGFSDQGQAEMTGQLFQGTLPPPTPESVYSAQTLQRSPFGSSRSAVLQTPSTRPYLDSQEEVLLMQVFIEEVGLWMDSMDAAKHFTDIIPFHALSEPMLLNAILACGARHLFLVNPQFGEERALYYYNASTRELLSCLQNPSRDTILCATTAVILNVYEIMCERAMQRMNHIAGARALIKECRWNARSTGIGGACFWLNVGMELLSCLHFNWKMAWEPDTWDVDMNMSASAGHVAGDEELWTHRMVYICAKIADFRASIPQFQRLDRATHDSRLGQRCAEWNDLKAWCDEWARCVPRSMQPLGYLQPWQSKSKSSFPEVWLVKRSAVVGRLFYHTANCLLATIHPLESEYSQEMLNLQQSHAQDLCGMVAHVKDRGVASVSLRCLAIAAECLVNRQSQEEVIQILDKIIKETGWQVSFLQHELIEKWGWNEANTASHTSQPDQDSQSLLSPSSELGSSLLNSSLGTQPPPPRPRLPQGIVNPLMATADFSFENHPYQNHWVAPENTRPTSHLTIYKYDSF